MKWSLGTAAVVGTIFCLLTFGRNGQHDAPNGSPLIAQEPTEKAKQDPAYPYGNPALGVSKAKKIGDEAISAEQQNARFEGILNGSTSFMFQGHSLEEIVEDIKTRHKIEIQIDKKALEEASFDSATRFDKQISGVRLRTAIELLLRDHNLSYQNYDGVLLITSIEKANENLTRRVYPRKGTFAQIEARQVYALLVTTIYPDTWRLGGGRGALNVLPDRIIVSNTDAVHRELEAFWKQNDAIDSSSEVKSKGDTFTEGDASSSQQSGGGLF